MADIISSQNRKVKRHHFTLVEMVVAMAIMLLVAIIIGSAASMFYNGYQRSAKASVKLREYMAIDRVWDDGVRNMVPFKWRDSNNESRFVFNGEENEILFTTLRRADGNAPGALLFVHIFLEDEKLIAEYSFFPRLPWAEEEDDDMGEFTREILAENIESLTFMYAEKSEDEEEPVEWLETWEEEEHDAIPLAVRMNIEWKDGTKEQWLRRVAGISGRSTLGNRRTVSLTDSSRNTVR